MTQNAFGHDGTLDAAPSWRAILADGRGARLVGLMAVIALHAGGNYAVITLAPSIIGELGDAALAGALTALFNVTTILAAAAIGPLSGRFGAVPILAAMAVICGLGAALSAMATSMSVVVIGRALAGFGGGGLLALAYVGMRAEATAAAFPKIAALAAAFWIGAAFAGPLLGGVLADFVGWRIAFGLIGASFIAYALANRGSIRAVAPPRVAEAFPFAPFLALGAGVALISFAPLFSLTTGLAMAMAGLGALLFAALRDRARAPRMFPRNAFRISTEQGAALLAKTVLGASSMSILVFGPLVLTRMHGHSALFAGGFIMIETIVWSAASFLVASVRFGRLLAMLGPLIALLGVAACVPFLIGGHLIGAAFAIALCGAGLGLAWPLLGAQIIAGDADGERAKTMAMLSSLETLGFAIGGAIIGLAGAWAAGGEIETPADLGVAAETALYVSIGFAALGAPLCVRALRARR